LSASLTPTGKQYSYQTTSDFGTFNPNSTFGSQYIGVNASGYYFDEVTNAVSSGPITLSGYSDLSAASVLNVNLLTTLAYQRIQNLVAQSNLTFAAAQSQAQSEVLAVFGMRDSGQFGPFNTWDISKGRDADHILAAISSVFVFGNTSGSLSSLIASVQSDLGADGVVDSAATKATLLASSRMVDPAAVAANLSQKYASAGVSFSAANIGDWLDPDGDGVVGKFKFLIPDATQASTFTLPTFVTELLAGSSIGISTGQLSVNGTPVTGPTPIASGDVVTIAPPSGAFPNGTLAVYVVNGATKLARVTFVGGLISIAVTPANAALQVGSVQSLMATGTFTDGSTADLTTSVTWSSSAPSFATINSTTGVAQGVSVGATVISATSGTISGSTTLNVVPAALQSIALMPTSLATGVGVARQLKATGTYSDGSTADLTPTATWTTSDPAVATVTGGMVTGVSLGGTNVIASVGALFGSATLDVTANVWSAAANMPSVRSSHTATVLPSGKVLVAGGQGETSASLKSTAIYDPVNDTWSSAPNMVYGRYRHAAVLLLNGKVLVAGGQGSLTGWRAEVELYDPSTNSWSMAASMPSEVSDQTVTLLADGKVLVAGGRDFSSTAAAAVYDPDTNTWTPVANMASARSNHTASLLPNGNVLVVGGTSAASAEIYDPAANIWGPAGSMSAARSYHTATTLPSGELLIAGGAGAEIYDPAGDTWVAAGSMATPRDHHAAVLLPTGKVLVIGGISSGTLASTEIYDPATDTWALGPPMASPSAQHTATVSNGLVVVIGRWSCELYW
jgi:N-acetylneuraminic acid mutarotase